MNRNESTRARRSGRAWASGPASGRNRACIGQMRRGEDAAALPRGWTLPTLLCLLALPLFVSQASSPDPRLSLPAPLTLDAAVTAALHDNAELNALRARAAAMQERPAQATALPNPMLTYGAMDAARDGAWPNTGEKRLMLQQPLPGYGKRDLRRTIAAKDAEVMRYDVDAMALDIVMQVKESYFDLYAVQRVIALIREDEQTLRTIVTITETMYATGERPQADVLKAQSEATMQKQKVLDLLAREATLKARLNLLLNRSAETAIGAIAPPPQPAFDGAIETLYASSSTNRPEVQAAEVRRERYRLEQKLMAREGAPDYTVGLEYRSLDAGEDMVMATVGVELPLWRSKVRAGVREAHAMQTASEAEYIAAERRSAFDVQDAAFQFLAARQTLALYTSELIPQAEARYAASEAGYRTGKGDFMDLLESQRFRLNAKMMAAMTEGAIGMQAARLERASGATVAAKGDGK